MVFHMVVVRPDFALLVRELSVNRLLFLEFSLAWSGEEFVGDTVARFGGRACSGIIRGFGVVEWAVVAVAVSRG